MNQEFIRSLDSDDNEDLDENKDFGNEIGNREDTDDSQREPHGNDNQRNPNRNWDIVMHGYSVDDQNSDYDSDAYRAYAIEKEKRDKQNEEDRRMFMITIHDKQKELFRESLSKVPFLCLVEELKNWLNNSHGCSLFIGTIIWEYAADLCAVCHEDVGLYWKFLCGCSLGVCYSCFGISQDHNCIPCYFCNEYICIECKMWSGTCIKCSMKVKDDDVSEICRYVELFS